MESQNNQSGDNMNQLNQMGMVDNDNYEIENTNDNQ